MLAIMTTSSARTKIIGHGGSGGHAPPSSAPTIEKCLELGSGAIELDVQFAADATPVVFHDPTLRRAAGVNGTIRNQDMRELGGYDVGFRYGDRYRGLRLLTLEEAAGLIPDDVDIFIDIKDFDPVNAKQLRGLLSILKQAGGLERCLFTSASEEVLTTLGRTDGSIRRGLKTSDARSESVERAASLGCTSLHPDASSTRRPLVEACRKQGIAIFPHSAHDSRSLRSLVDLEVDGLSTGYPERLGDITSSGRGRGRGRASSPREARREPEPPAETPAAGREEEEPIPEAAGEAPASETAPAPGGAGETGEASAGPSDGQKKRRRRGRRGGKREQARRARRTQAPDGTDEEARGGAEVIPLEPVEDEAQPLELLSEIHAELDREGTADSGAQGAGDGKKRRRRGRRGGKRVQARRHKKSQSGESPDS